MSAARTTPAAAPESAPLAAIRAAERGVAARLEEARRRASEARDAAASAAAAALAAARARGEAAAAASAQAGLGRARLERERVRAAAAAEVWATRDVAARGMDRLARRVVEAVLPEIDAFRRGAAGG
jgi:hypothetical protein